MKMKGFPGWLALADESCCYILFPFSPLKLLCLSGGCFLNFSFTCIETESLLTHTNLCVKNENELGSDTIPPEAK